MTHTFKFSTKLVGGTGGKREKYVKCHFLTSRKLEFIPLRTKWTFLLPVTNYDKANIFQSND